MKRFRVGKVRVDEGHIQRITKESVGTAIKLYGTPESTVRRIKKEYDQYVADFEGDEEFIAERYFPTSHKRIASTNTAVIVSLLARPDDPHSFRKS